MTTSKSYSMLFLCHSTAVSCTAGVLTFLKLRPSIGEINTKVRYDDTANIFSECFPEIHSENLIKEFISSY